MVALAEDEGVPKLVERPGIEVVPYGHGISGVCRREECPAIYGAFFGDHGAGQETAGAGQTTADGSQDAGAEANYTDTGGDFGGGDFGGF